MTSLEALYLTGKTNTVRIQADAAWVACDECTDGIRIIEGMNGSVEGGTNTEVCTTCDGSSRVADTSGPTYTVVFRRASEMPYAEFLDIWLNKDKYESRTEEVHAQVAAHVLSWDFPDERPDTLARVLREMGIDQAEIGVKDFSTARQEDKEIERIKRLHDQIQEKLPTAPIPSEDPDILKYIRARWADELALAIAEDQSEAFTINLANRNKTN